MFAKRRDSRSAAGQAPATPATVGHDTVGHDVVGHDTVGHDVVGHDVVGHSPHAAAPAAPAAPIVPAVDGKWETHHAHMIEQVAPAGYLEHCLAERVALLTWRLRRLARFETAAGGDDPARVPERAGDRLDDAFPTGAAQLGEAATRPHTPTAATLRDSETIQLFERFPRLGDEAPLDSADAIALVGVFLDVEPLVHIEATDLPGIPKGVSLADYDGWTAGLVRRILAHVAALAGKHAHELYATALAFTRYRVTHATKGVPLAAARTPHPRQEQALPPPEILDRVMRYETHLSRELIAALHELEALQLRRAGQPELVHHRDTETRRGDGSTAET